MQPIHRHFADGKPDYLVRHYWWAYLWRVGVWFFDHQPIINAILFGQYRKLMTATLSRLPQKAEGRMLQLTCVYGELTPHLLARATQPLHLTDVAEVQLALADRKCLPGALARTRMNAEALGYKSGVFSTVVLFFLLHEMPDVARRNTLSEAIRVLTPGGKLLLTEYGPRPHRHPLHRFSPTRWLLGKLEPFLPGFWDTDLPALIEELAAEQGRSVRLLWQQPIFGGFYRMLEFSFEKQSH